jgi:3-oxoacyl-[acyl-carrier-protein] synthase III
LPKVKISALGCYVPPGVLTNKDLERMVDTNSEWIMERTGICERHIAAPEMATSDMGTEAARVALAARGITGAELDAILVCTVTPDMLFPATACLIQDHLGAHRAWGFDLIAACSSFLYGLTTGAALIAAGTHRKVLVIGADTMSRIIDYTDRATCILFGDGAGAMLLEPTGESDEGAGFIDFIGEIDGSGGDFLKMPAGGSRLPASAETVEKRLHYVHQQGQQVFKYAVKKMYEMCAEVLGSQRPEAVRREHPDPPPGQPPHHHRRVRTHGPEARTGADQYRPLRQYDLGYAAAGHPGCHRAGTPQERRPGDVRHRGAGYTAGASLWRWAY